MFGFIKCQNLVLLSVKYLCIIPLAHFLSLVPLLASLPFHSSFYFPSASLFRLSAISFLLPFLLLAVFSPFLFLALHFSSFPPLSC